MEDILYWTNHINNWVWGPPLLILVLFVGTYLTVVLKGVQFRHLWYAHKLAFTKHDSGAQGDISHFQALMIALAGTLGTGSIAGVATAITAGGLGSIFWMWVAALIGMATKYGEAILAIKYRKVDEHGQMNGGPMYYLERGVGSKVLAVLFAIFAAITAIGTGNMVQCNSVASALNEMFSVRPLWVGIGLVIATGLPLLGGVKSISKVASILVPAKVVVYFIGSLVIIAINYEKIPHAFQMIVGTAFTGQAAVGGFIGSSVMMAIQLGVSRGVFSNEAGLGSSPIAAAAARTSSPGRQALVSMSSVFITTGIACTLTALVIATTGVLGDVDADGNLLNGAALVVHAFDTVIPYGGFIVAISLISFAYSTILGWAYYGEKATEYLCGIRGVIPYRILYTLLVIPGAVLNLRLVWDFANIMNGLMAFPNLIGLILLARVIVAENNLLEDLIHNEKPRKKSKLRRKANA
ncbi:MAG: sodium:alanine symporter family protein [Verrucomicrobia bacterium]|nr:sodium:alanine symporter family protein [Verrucomicrobiota bacterium]